MSHSSSKYSDSDSSSTHWQQCDLTLRYSYISHVIIAATLAEAQAHAFLHLKLVTSAQACSPNTKDFVEVMLLS